MGKENKAKNELEKQMALLSKLQSETNNINDIIALSCQITEIAKALMCQPCYQEAVRASRQC